MIFSYGATDPSSLFVDKKAAGFYNYDILLAEEMTLVMDWDFTLANYGPVWSFVVQLGLLLLFLMLGNILRRTIPLFGLPANAILILVPP